MKKVLADGDIFVYRCGFAAQHTYYDLWKKEDVEPDGLDGEWGVKPSARECVMSFDDAKSCNKWVKDNPKEAEGLVRIPRITVEPVENALHIVNIIFGALEKRYGNDIIVYFSCPTAENWRTEFYPEYKANRPDRKPFHAQAIRDHIEAKWKCESRAPYEADDLIAMAAGGDTVVVSIDKDLLQLPGLHYNWVKEEETHVSDAEGLQSVLVQAIAGDSTDNIKGIPGWGPKAATEWLSQPYDTGPWGNVLGAYKDVFGDKPEAYYQFALNKALVTLPTSEKERKALSLEVHNELEASQTGPSGRGRHMRQLQDSARSGVDDASDNAVAGPWGEKDAPQGSEAPVDDGV